MVCSFCEHSVGGVGCILSCTPKDKVVSIENCVYSFGYLRYKVVHEKYEEVWWQYSSFLVQ
jgi:hypothetical protein